jgi:nicotinamide-nucleotide amidase
MMADSLLELAQEVGERLRQNGQFLVLAESCTGGLASATLVAIPGASHWFCGSLVTYRPESKSQWLGVPAETIRTDTDVSLATTRAMATGALRRTPEATWSAAITGYLGPDASQTVDGLICLVVARRGLAGVEMVAQGTESLPADGRIERQQHAAAALFRIILKAVSPPDRWGDAK